MRKISVIILAGLLFWAHLALLVYTNTPFLLHYLSLSSVSIVFGASSLLSIAFVLYLPHLIRKRGVLGLILWLILCDAVLLLLLAHGASSSILPLLFIIYCASTILVTSLFDLLIEHYSPVARTGRIRGLYLMLASALVAAGPGIASLIGAGRISHVYVWAALFAALSLICTATLVGRIHPKTSLSIPSWRIVAHRIRNNKPLRQTFFAECSLQFFYGVMTIYLSDYLIKSFGLSFETIGIVLTVMLLPFVLIEYPLGILCDRFHLEQSLQRLGFLIMALGTALLTVSPVGSVACIAGSLFLSRVGAASVEVATESSFFKHTREEESDVLSLFRSLVPFSIFAGSAFGFLLLPFGSWSIFLVLAIAMVIVSVSIEDL